MISTPNRYKSVFQDGTSRGLDGDSRATSRRVMKALMNLQDLRIFFCFAEVLLSAVVLRILAGMLCRSAGGRRMAPITTWAVAKLGQVGKVEVPRTRNLVVGVYYMC